MDGLMMCLYDYFLIRRMKVGRNDKGLHWYDETGHTYPGIDTITDLLPEDNFILTYTTLKETK